MLVHFNYTSGHRKVNNVNATNCSSMFRVGLDASYVIPAQFFFCICCFYSHSTVFQNNLCSHFYIRFFFSCSYKSDLLSRKSHFYLSYICCMLRHDRDTGFCTLSLVCVFANLKINFKSIDVKF